MDNFLWTCQNQGILQKIYNEKKHQIYLAKNRLEKYRQREKSILKKISNNNINV